MRLTEHFTLEEFTASELASRRGIDNSLPASLLPAAQRTCELLERIRAHLRAPIVVTSGYRCLALNRALGSADTSDHTFAAAADFKVPAFGPAYQVARALEERLEELQIGQLIHEFGSWIHVSTREPAKPINRVITISRRGVVPGIVEV